MKIKTFKYFFWESISSVKRNRVMSAASITTVAAALFIFGVFMLLVVNVNKIVSTVESEIEIKVFLEKDVTTIQKQQIEKDIKAIDEVKEIHFESQEEALEKFKEGLGEKADLADGLELENPLPASFILKVNSPQDVAVVSAKLKDHAGIEKINDGQQMVETIIKVTGFIKITSILLMIILGVISISLISNTIKLTVFARKREIGIMKYIGATDWFIRWPFVIEGMLMGLFGAVISILILGFGYGYGAKIVTDSQMIFALVPANEIILSLGWQFSLIGIFIGGIGSLLSIRKFLVV
jgi:cell division transport system permease protein